MKKRKSAHTHHPKTAARTTSRASAKVNDAKETRRFFTVFGVVTLILIVFLYLIFVRR